MILNQETGAKTWKPSVVRKISIPKKKKVSSKSAWERKKEIEGAAKKNSQKTRLKRPAKGNDNPNGWKHAPADIGPVSKKKTVTKPKTVSSKSSGSSGGKSNGSSGGKSSGSSGGTSSGKTTTTKPTTNTTTTKTTPRELTTLEKLWLEATGYKSQINGLMKDGFKYDPKTDAAYKSLQATAQSQAKAASGEALEIMNDRGIINSTVTGDRLGQIQQTAQDAVTAQIPNLQAQAYSQYQDKVSGLFKLWETTLGRAQDERNFNEDHNRWSQEFEQSKNQWDQEFTYKQGQDAIQNDIAYQNANTAAGNLSLSELKFTQSMNGEKDKKATQAAISELLLAKTADDAMSLLTSRAVDYYNGNVDLSEVLTSLGKRWGAAFTTKAENTQLSFPSS